MDKQLEIFRHNKYRKMRVRFYGLSIVAISLLSLLIGIVVISNQPIDVSNVKKAETAYEVAYAEYGDTYINTLNKNGYSESGGYEIGDYVDNMYIALQEDGRIAKLKLELSKNNQKYSTEFNIYIRNIKEESI